MNSESYIDILCEDFVTCIACDKNIDSHLDDIKIYTGLKNGKLIEWVIKQSKDEKKYLIRERKKCFCHKGEITCMELYENQKIIITGGKDKMIFIRKTYDFELLTVIDLTYLYGNRDIVKEINIVPTLIKVSDLNCIYVMVYNYNTKKSFIRGYNLNGLFFAQTEEDEYMNICFTKNCSLLVSCYNKDKFYILNSYDLQNVKFDLKISEFTENIVNNKNKKKKEEKNNNILIWMEYNYKNQEFTLLFDDKIIVGCIQDKEKQLQLDSY
jgi:WD40 repeat protein